MSSWDEDEWPAAYYDIPAWQVWLSDLVEIAAGIVAIGIVVLVALGVVR